MYTKNFLCTLLFTLAVLPGCKKESVNVIPEAESQQKPRLAIPATVAGTRYFEGVHQFLNSNSSGDSVYVDSVQMTFIILSDTTLVISANPPGAATITDTVLLSRYYSIMYHPGSLYFDKKYGNPNIPYRTVELYCDTSGNYMPRYTFWTGTYGTGAPYDSYLLSEMK